jgi:hypothetical protein
MNELNTLRNALAQNIAGLRVAERQASRALIVAECAINNVAGQHGIPVSRSLTQTSFTDTDTRVAAALARVQAGLAAGTAQLA